MAKSIGRPRFLPYAFVTLKRHTDGFVFNLIYEMGIFLDVIWVVLCVTQNIGDLAKLHYPVLVT